MIKLTTLEFEDYALIWWNQVTNERERGKRKEIVTWRALNQM